MEIASLMLIVAACTTSICASYKFMQIITKEVRKASIASVALSSQKPGFKDYFLAISRMVFGQLATRFEGQRLVQKYADKVCLYLEIKGKEFTSHDVICESLLALVCALIFGLAISGSLLFGVSFAFLMIAFVYVFCGSRIAANSAEMREQVPDALRCLQSCFRAGLSLLQSLEEAAKECTGALSKVFLAASRRLAVGEPVGESLSVFKELKEVPELKFLALAFEIQHISGGSIGPVLESAREAVLMELDLARTLRIQTTQAKMSATIVTLMPFLLMALFSFASPGFITPFFSSFAGVAILAMAIIMQVAGVLSVRRILARAEA